MFSHQLHRRALANMANSVARINKKSDPSTATNEKASAMINQRQLLIVMRLIVIIQ